jgi:hypothetical protein
MCNPLSRRGVLGGLLAAIASVLHKSPPAPAPEQPAPPTTAAEQRRYSYVDAAARWAAYDHKAAARSGKTFAMTVSSDSSGAVEPPSAEPKPDPTA